jgi:beta-glucosidase
MVARRAAAASIVLLKNAAGALPLRDEPGLRIAVIGEFARRPYVQGVGSSEVTPLRLDIPLDDLAAALPSASIRFAPGYPLRREGADGGKPGHVAPDAMAAEAMRAARDADVVIVFLGLPPGAEVEHIDRRHIDLPAAQTDLVRQLAGCAAPIVAVLFNGSVVRISTWDDHVSAVLECWLPGQAAGSALADVLAGRVNPSGRLAETIPLRLEDVPSYLSFPGEEGHVRYGERMFVGYRGYDATTRPVAYPFGHGLSYTRFEYRDLRVRKDGDGLAVTCVVANAGDRAGHEVVQLYVGDPASRVARPPRELKGFTRTYLESGASREVGFTLTPRDLSYWSASRRKWMLEPGEFRIDLGASSRDIRLTAGITV